MAMAKETGKGIPDGERGGFGPVLLGLRCCHPELSEIRPTVT